MSVFPRAYRASSRGTFFQHPPLLDRERIPYAISREVHSISLPHYNGNSHRTHATGSEQFPDRAFAQLGGTNPENWCLLPEMRASPFRISALALLSEPQASCAFRRRRPSVNPCVLVLTKASSWTAVRACAFAPLSLTRSFPTALTTLQGFNRPKAALACLSRTLARTLYFRIGPGALSTKLHQRMRLTETVGRALRRFRIEVFFFRLGHLMHGGENRFGSEHRPFGRYTVASSWA